MDLFFLFFFASFIRQLIYAQTHLQQALIWACLASADWLAAHCSRLQRWHSRYREQTGGSGVGRCYCLIMNPSKWIDGDNGSGGGEGLCLTGELFDRTSWPVLISRDWSVIIKAPKGGGREGGLLSGYKDGTDTGTDNMRRALLCVCETNLCKDIVQIQISTFNNQRCHNCPSRSQIT